MLRRNTTTSIPGYCRNTSRVCRRSTRCRPQSREWEFRGEPAGHPFLIRFTPSPRSPEACAGSARTAERRISRRRTPPCIGGVSTRNRPPIRTPSAPRRTTGRMDGQMVRWPVSAYRRTVFDSMRRLASTPRAAPGPSRPGGYPAVRAHPVTSPFQGVASREPCGSCPYWPSCLTCSKHVSGPR